jgi:ribonuclease P protein component
LGSAVVRNRVKRLLREAFRSRPGDVDRGHDYVLVARPDAGALAEREGLAGVEAAVAELLREAASREPARGSAGRSPEPAGEETV